MNSLSMLAFKKAKNTEEKTQEEKMLELMNPSSEFSKKPPPATEEASPPPNYKAMADTLIALLSDIKMNDGVSISTQFYNPNIVRIVFKGAPYESYKYTVYISIQLPGKIISGNTYYVREDDMTKIKSVLATLGGKYRKKSRYSKRSKRFKKSKKTKRK